MPLSSTPFCPLDSRQAGLWYLAARWRDTTHFLRTYILYSIANIYFNNRILDRE
jgi:hypothetical protein